MDDKCQTVLVHLPNESVVYEVFREIHLFYKPIHTYLSIILCILGTVANFCNIVVLTRRQMRTPVNMILTAMACCDTVVLFSNLIYTTHYSFVAFKNCHPRHWSYSWALFLIAHAHISLVGHSSSVWLSVMLALIRYMTLRSRGSVSSHQISLKHSYIAIAGTICFVAMFNSPNFLTYKITELPLRETCRVIDRRLWNEMAYLPGIAEIALSHHCFGFRAAFWISGLVFKIIPCCLLSLFVWLLLRILDEVKANRQRLLKTSRHTVSNSSTRNGRTSLTPGDKTLRQNSIRGRGEKADRTTHMLLAIVFVMLITEIPQGVMAMLSGMISTEFRKHIYNNVGDLLDLLSLCEACTSFIIYCSMSGQFRNEFRRVFIPQSWKCKEDAAHRRQSDTYTKMSYMRTFDFTGSQSPCSNSEVGAVKLQCGNSHVRRNSTEITHGTSDTRLTPLTPQPASPFPGTPRDPLLDPNRPTITNGSLASAIANGAVKENQYFNI